MKLLYCFENIFIEIDDDFRKLWVDIDHLDINETHSLIDVSKEEFIGIGNSVFNIDIHILLDKCKTYCEIEWNTNEVEYRIERDEESFISTYDFNDALKELLKK